MIKLLRNIPKSYKQLSSIQFLFCFALATGSYLTVFLQKNGFTPAEVGFINAANFAVSICAMLFWGMWADKLRSIRKVFLFCISIAVVLWTFVPASVQIFVGPVLLVYLLIPVSAFFRIPAQTLVEALVVQNCAKEKIAYGSVRFWGSISFAIMAILLGAILPWAGVEASFYLYGISFLPLIIIIFKLKNTSADSAPGKGVPLKEMKFGLLFKNYYFLTYIVFAIFINIPMNTTVSFLPYLVETVGGDSAQLGLVTGFKALLEIPMILLIKPMRRRFPLPVVIILAGVIFIVEFILYSGANGMAQILAIQALHGLGGGLMLGAVPDYVFAMSPEGLNSTAHTVNSSMNSVAAILGNILGGMLITFVGIRQFYMVAAAVIVCAVIYFSLTLLFGCKVLKKPIPTL